MKNILNRKITFRLSEIDFHDFNLIFSNAKVNKKKYTTSDFIRDKVFDKKLSEQIKVVQTNTVYRDRFCPDESLKIYYLSKIGNNINQIAKYANSNKQIDHHVLKELEKTNKYLVGLL